MDQPKYYKIKDGFIMRTIAGESTIIPIDPDSDIKNGVLSPNDSAAFLWEVFQRPCTIEDAVNRVQEEYDVDNATVRAAVERFVNDLLHYRIMREEEYVKEMGRTAD